MQTITLAAAIASALMAGIFFAFSSFVMTALKNLQPDEGMRAMQRINIDVLCWPFMLLFFGLPMALAALTTRVVFSDTGIDVTRLSIATAIYWGGSLLVTIAGNVPMNNRLAGLDSNTSTGIDYWRTYTSRWTHWNHVRTVACALTSALLISAV